MITAACRLVLDWMNKFGQDTPPTPRIPSYEVRKLRAKLMLEEAIETCLALGMHIKVYSKFTNTVVWITSIEDYKNFIEVERGGEPNLKEIFDGCLDTRFVEMGTLVACGLAFKDEEGFNEVTRSNLSKLWTAQEVKLKHLTGGYNIYKVSEDERCFLVKNEDGKIIKSPSFSPANLQSIIDA